MNNQIPAGAKRAIDGQWRIHYDGYWIKAYDAPADSLLAKKRLIEALTRRLFNHVEHGMNIPGTRLDEARRAYEGETDPHKIRIKGAMLAGALFNRATDVFRKVVEIQALGIEIRTDNALMRQCGEHLQEALSLGRMVRHRSGEEGIDELWGEPFKAFAFPIEDFYKSRYIKIAQTMGAIDRIRDALLAAFAGAAMFAGLAPLIGEFAEAAKVRSETLNTDAEIFDVWATFVAAGEKLSGFDPALRVDPVPAEERRAALGLRLLEMGKDLVFHITRARVPMPKSTDAFIQKCQQYQGGLGSVPEAGNPNRAVDRTAELAAASQAELR